MLTWPDESVSDKDAVNQWQHAGTNLCLDFHGDPARAEVVVLSDGNHHMALNEVVRGYVADNPTEPAPFYATFPPSVIALILRDGQLRMGNLVLSLNPGVLLGPPQLFERLGADNLVERTKPFMRGRGSALLLAKGNPKRIGGVADLTRADVRLFISNPETETVSHRGYADVLRRAAADFGISDGFLDPASGRLLYGQRIHHREAPEAVAQGSVDVAIVYYHLALRYCRVFPDLFEMCPVDAAVQHGPGVPEAERSQVLAAMLPNPSDAVRRFFEFLDSELVTEIYAYHGMDRAY